MGDRLFILIVALFAVFLAGFPKCGESSGDPDPIDPIEPQPVSTPCPDRPGAPKPWEGVLGNGNLQLDAALSVSGIGLIYNSVDASCQEGFGHGWRLSVRSTLDTDELGNVVVTRPDGTPVRFDFDGSGFRAEPLTFSRLSRDEQGDFTETFPGGQRNVYKSFAGRHYLHRIIDRNGNTTTIHRDANGRETSLTGPYGRTVTFSFNDGFLQAVTDSEGRTFVPGYNPAGELESITHPAVEAGIPVARFGYDGDGAHLVVSRSTPAGLTTRFEYHPGGVLKAVTGPAGYDLLVEYTGTSVTRRYSMGEEVIQRYADGQLVEETNDLGLSVYYNRDARHRITMITDSLGHAWELSYNDRDDLIREKDPRGLVTEIEYDSDHNPVRVTRAGLVWSYQFDSHNLVTRATDPAGHTTEYLRDQRGNLTRVVDHTGVTRSQASYNPDGSVSSITNMLGDRVAFSYDDYGNLISLEHPDMGTIEVQSTPMGLMEEQISNFGRQTSLSYDARAALHEYSTSGLSAKQNGGTTISLVRDLDNRVIGYRVCGPDDCESGGQEFGPGGNLSREQVNGNDVQDGECPCVDPPAP